MVSYQPIHRVRGAALFVALIMLLLLTLLGVTAAQTSALQERMSGSFRVQQLAFERAESQMSAGRDKAADPLYAYDQISDIPLGLASDNAAPWDSWATTSSEHSQLNVRACGGPCPQRLGSGVGEDPNRKPRFFSIAAQQKDMAATDDATAAWATVQTVYVF